MQGVILDDRLSKIYSAVGKCGVVVDVGTDHGKLPANLIINNKCNKALLVDISAASLQKSINLFNELNISNKAEFIVSDGLINVNTHFDTVVIAGMGTPTIISILNNALDKLNGANLILCSNTKLDVLRQHIYSINYSIAEEYVAEAAGKFYVIIKAIPVKGAGGEKLYFNGKVIEYQDKALTKKYLKHVRGKLQKSLKGSLSSKSINHSLVDNLNKKLSWIDEDISKI